GGAWRAAGFELRVLARQFFGSRLFYAPEFRGNFLKSPIQFYLGAVQDFGLDVAPLPRLTLNPLRQMGQILFYPPNVRGWVGGRNWINSTSLAARRTVVDGMFAPFNERALNQDEIIEVAAAKTNGRDVFTVTPDRFKPLLELEPEAAAQRLAAAFLPVRPPDPLVRDLAGFIGQD